MLVASNSQQQQPQQLVQTVQPIVVPNDLLSLLVQSSAPAVQFLTNTPQSQPIKVEETTVSNLAQQNLLNDPLQNVVINNMTNKIQSSSSKPTVQELLEMKSNRAKANSKIQDTSNQLPTTATDGEFRIPKNPPTTSNNTHFHNNHQKKRVVIMEPHAKPNQQKNKILNDLLTGKISQENTSYHLKNEQVKKEKNYVPIKPATSIHTIQTQQPINNPISSSNSIIDQLMTDKPNVNDFQRQVLIHAAGHACQPPVLQPQSPVNTTFIQQPSTISSGAKITISPPTSQVGSTFETTRRKLGHKNAEQKRRVNIKYGFDTLHELVPSLNSSSPKVSKAVTLTKAAEYIRKLKAEKQKCEAEMESLRKEIEELNNEISNCQAQLPATGVPVTRQRADHMKNMLNDYVKKRTLSNWKFWIFSIIIKPLFDTFRDMVSTANEAEMCRTVLAWLEQHCSLLQLRPGVLSSLRELSTKTAILTDPSKVPEQATLAVQAVKL